ncbi:acetyl-CoA carboxylase carboxyltransferase subunit alpha [Natronogracilivirga saccharolytica]|uniref:Acetyl-coenzyme A carboxylase carboxyl transferase subunit alpha n=1 Tax=Natronogracilivirga saccharolytica TaxID=2812953 RepID=A0A8J7RHV2_9BACT|nr:acetyl-CoA carboxylase carboxyltransferase subunit alpha [Natronogracilivirga saccharolytica]MBP3191482.1 acetyl-CoA carboxylase carboxyltransferase subunit alpha [Natronogracilivirga saccharolytica]
MNYLDFEKPIIELEKKISELSELHLTDDNVLTPEIERLRSRVEELRKSIFTNLTHWQRVQLARHPDRPYTLDYVYKLTENFIELHGDRCYSDDKAIVGGLAAFRGRSVMIIGHQKGRDTKSRKYRNFGMPNPDGYRKALRLMKTAEKFGIPVITMLDTPGAFPGLEAEERGQAEAIARNLREMALLRVPVVTVVIGEGASGGALGIGMGNEVYMMENTWYSVISPESCSSILWKTWDYKEQAARALKLSAKDLMELEVIDGIISEPLGGAHRDYDAASVAVGDQIAESLDRLSKMKPDKLKSQRIEKYSQMGSWSDTSKK